MMVFVVWIQSRCRIITSFWQTGGSHYFIFHEALTSICLRKGSVNVLLLVFPKSTLTHSHLYSSNAFKVVASNHVLQWLQHSQSFRSGTLAYIPRCMSTGKEMRLLLWYGMRVIVGSGWHAHLQMWSKDMASVNHPIPVSQGSTPTTPFRVPSPIGKPISQYSEPVQCQSVSRALYPGRFSHLELHPLYFSDSLEIALC